MKKERKLKIIIFSVIIILIVASISTLFIIKFGKKDVSSDKYYVSNDLQLCSQIKFLCKTGYEYFSDSKGCGCSLISNAENKTFCAEKDKNADVCATIYFPVCGWFNSEKIQCIKYPCAQTFSNGCSACKSENIQYYTQGECPK